MTCVFLVPVSQVPKHEGRLRLKPARNNQKRGVRLAKDYLIDRWTADALSELVRQPAPLKLAA